MNLLSITKENKLKLKLLLFLGLFFFNCKNNANNSKEGEINPFTDFKNLLSNIRTYAISPDSARTAYQGIMEELHRIYPPEHPDSNYVPQITFPLRTKDFKSVGGKGKGFYPKNFDLFDMSVSGSHPAHDIFVYDTDHDSREEGSLEYIDCVAVLKSVVLATEANWTDSSNYKGGNYVWLYDLETGSLWYYAHLREVTVKPGQILESGDIVGQVGRTGFNAENNRSDTHLHLMLLRNGPDNLPKPYNYYDWLLNANTQKEKKIPKT